MIGLLTFLPTVAFVPHSVYILAILWAYMRQWNGIKGYQFRQELNKYIIDFSILAMILILSSVNYFFSYGIEHAFSSSAPSFFLLPFTFLIAMSLNKRDVKVLVILILIEALSVVIQYMLGVSTFFSSISRYSEWQETDLLYYKRPLGLSYNSSIAASKFLIGFIIIDLVDIKKYWRILLQVFLSIAIFMTFNRTVFVAVFVYIILSLGKNLIVQRFNMIKWSVNITLAFVISIGITFFMVEYWDLIIDQLTRRKGSIEMSGRDKIWTYFIEFISDNWIFGNGGKKMYFGHLHAHNSFIQLISTNGIIISALYFYLILRNINWSNFIIILTIIFYSLTQFGIFWGISLMDIVFMYALLKISGKLKNPKEILSTSS